MQPLPRTTRDKPAVAEGPMRVGLVTLGTDGDVFPYAGLGKILQARGHHVALLASASYEPLARQHGFAFQALVSQEENDGLFGHPDFWHPLKTASLSARWGRRLLQRHYELISGWATPDTVLVANPGVLAAQLVHEKHGVPLASVILQPWAIPSSLAPPVMPYLGFLQRAPRPVWRAFWRSLDLMVDLLVGPELNRLRSTLGLPPVRRIFSNWLSPQLAIGMFPDWYARPQKDWPPSLRLTGFPLSDRGRDEPLPPDVERFCAAGAAPVAFTFGTGMAHPARQFRAALEACRRLDTRGIFLTRFRDQLPAPLPSSILACDYAPFRQLFPKCSAVVHHGGIGTTAQVMAAGIPQLIHPVCFDQEDNGMRVQRLGIGRCLRTRHASGHHLAAVLRDLLTGRCREACLTVQARFEQSDALERSADLIESLASIRRPLP